MRLHRSRSSKKGGDGSLCPAMAPDRDTDDERSLPMQSFVMTDVPKSHGAVVAVQVKPPPLRLPGPLESRALWNDSYALLCSSPVARDMVPSGYFCSPTGRCQRLCILHF